MSLWMLYVVLIGICWLIMGGMLVASIIHPPISDDARAILLVRLCVLSMIVLTLAGLGIGIFVFMRSICFFVS